jgi:hypothetical protein
MSDTKDIKDSEYKQRRVYTLRQAADEMGVSYVSLWRAAARGDLRVLKGFPRLAISAAELERFLSSNTEYSPRRRKAVPLLERKEIAGGAV